MAGNAITDNTMSLRLSAYSLDKNGDNEVHSGLDVEMYIGLLATCTLWFTCLFYLSNTSAVQWQFGVAVTPLHLSTPRGLELLSTWRALDSSQPDLVRRLGTRYLFYADENIANGPQNHCRTSSITELQKSGQLGGVANSRPNSKRRALGRLRPFSLPHMSL